MIKTKLEHLNSSSISYYYYFKLEITPNVTPYFFVTVNASSSSNL